jgi:hypothetical protein
MKLIVYPKIFVGTYFFNINFIWMKIYILPRYFKEEARAHK